MLILLWHVRSQHELQPYSCLVAFVQSECVCVLGSGCRSLVMKGHHLFFHLSWHQHCWIIQLWFSPYVGMETSHYAAVQRLKPDSPKTACRELRDVVWKLLISLSFYVWCPPQPFIVPSSSSISWSSFSSSAGRWEMRRTREYNCSSCTCRTIPTTHTNTSSVWPHSYICIDINSYNSSN